MARPRAGSTRVQFHPEVVHTTRGKEYLANFVFGVCGCRKDWDSRHRAPLLEAGNPRVRGRPQRLLLRQRRRGFDRGLRALPRGAGAGSRARRLRGHRPDARGRNRIRARAFGQPRRVEHARGAVPGARWPGSPIPSASATSSARSSCGCRSASSNRDRLLDENWILGQGTIYPDTIESGGTAKAATDQDASQPRGRHSEADRRGAHRRAAAIVLQGRSARRSAARLGLPSELLDRHPFPGPGLAIRCLCSESDAPLRRRPRAASCRCTRWACRAIRAPTRRCWRSTPWTMRAPPS